MRNLYFLSPLLVLIIIGCTQSPEKIMKERISGISTLSEASVFLSNNEDVRGYTIDVDSTEKYFNSIRSLKPGDVFVFQSDDSDQIQLIKFLSTRIDTMSQVRVMNLDGDSLNTTQLDSLQTFILEKVKAGEKFEDLVETYSLEEVVTDGGVYPWKIGTHIPEWENGVRNHAPGEVFTINQPERKLYYIIQVLKKSYLNEFITVMVVNADRPAEK